jgi:predicted TIM-barrel fold metal-dependent hydrolase
MYDPFWAAAQELCMPISLHSITGAGPESRLVVKAPMDRYIRSTVLSHEVQRTFTTLIFSGVLERFPQLKFVSAENEVGWLSFFLQKLDQAQEEYQYLYPSPLKMKPSDYFHRQCYATFIDDPVGVATRHFIGVENILWSSDYPHTVSTWPHSQEVVERHFQGVPEPEKRQIVRGNAMQLYGLELP